jgi:phosphatidylserine/phosphatidylglycerophosphate/cardiolipin synthase-like enzyme
MMIAQAPFVPRFACLDATGVARVLWEWLQRPSLRRATLVSFAFDPEYRWSNQDASTQRLVNALGRAAGQADVTLLVATTVAQEESDSGWRRRQALTQLAAAGATVLCHATLHAKVFLFEEDDRSCWVVGSSNLTPGGLGKNSEVSLRGFHPSDFGSVREAVVRLTSEAQPY